MSLLRYTGHPFIDVGVATIVANAEVNSPDQVTTVHLEHLISQTILPIYMNPAMAGYLSYVVFANARFANPAQIRNPQYDEPRKRALLSLLNLWKPDAPIPAKEEPADEGEKCVFSGDPAIIRASRMLVPMTTDETNSNFVPEGRPRLPVSGWCLLALLAMPLGALNSNGKMWLVHSTDAKTLQHFAGENLSRNKRSFQLSGLEKLPNYKFAKTYLMADLITAQRQSHHTVNVPLTAYLFTSSGQKSEIDIFHLPSSVLSFISAARRLYPSAWTEVVERAKVLQSDKEVEEPGKPVYQERNFFYEDLFELPHRAAYFLRRYLMRLPIRGKPTGKQKIDPRYSYSFVTERKAISWGLTVLFLERVMRMDKERIESIRKMGDGLAEYIQKTDRRLFKQLFTARSDYHMRLALLKAANNAQNTLLKWDEFISVFFVDEGDTLRPDWYLARDLLMLRIIEQLHQENWIEHNFDLIDETNSAIELPHDQ